MRPPYEENLLGLSDPDQFHCRTQGFATGHSHLWVEVVKRSRMEELHIHVSFYMVYLIDTPARWTGANFCLAHSEDRWDLLDQLGIMPRDSQDSFMVEGVSCQNRWDIWVG